MFQCDECMITPKAECRECLKYNNFWDSSPYTQTAQTFLPVLPRVKSIRNAGSFEFVCPECQNIEKLTLGRFIGRLRKNEAPCRKCDLSYGLSTKKFKKSLAEHSPNIAAEWSKKNPITAEQVGYGSGKKFLWECSSCGFEWEDSPNARTNANRGCPQCNPRVVKAGENDLATVRPEVLDWWDDESDPRLYMPFSSKRVWFKCDRGHRFQQPIKRFNKYCAECSNNNPSFRNSKTFAEVAYPEVLKKWSKKNEKNPEDYSYSSARKVWWECEKGHEWETAIYARLRNSCPYCYSTPQWEIELGEFLTEHNVTYILHDREIIKPLELDFYLPEHKIAIELNGLYWHSHSRLEDSKYHYKKWLACKEAGIQLITVWEDDWFNRKEIVLNAVKHKIGLSNQERIYARKTTVREISKLEAEEFLNANHIQGFKSGSIYLGLEAEDGIVAVAVYTIHGRIANLDRYATSRIVVGGMSKLLKNLRQFYPEVESVETFASHEVSDGGLYEKLGFKNVRELKPDYMYVVGGVREHKFNYRKERFKSDSGLVYVDGLTESQLASLNGLERVYDCGKTKYELIFT